MAYNGFAIDKYLDAAAVTQQLDELTKKAQEAYNMHRQRE